MRSRSRRALESATWLFEGLWETLLLDGLSLTSSFVFAMLPFDCHRSILKWQHRSWELSFLVEVFQSVIHHTHKICCQAHLRLIWADLWVEYNLEFKYELRHSLIWLIIIGLIETGNKNPMDTRSMKGDRDKGKSKDDIECTIPYDPSVTFYFPSMNFFKNSYFVLDEFLRIIENSQQVYEQFLRILVKFFRILYSFLRISDAALKNSCMNSWREGSRTTYELSEFIRTFKNKLCVHKNSSWFPPVHGVFMNVLTNFIMNSQNNCDTIFPPFLSWTKKEWHMN